MANAPIDLDSYGIPAQDPEEEHLRTALLKLITGSVQVLLEEKHLYQSVPIDVDGIKSVLKKANFSTHRKFLQTTSMPAEDELLYQLDEMANSLWSFDTENHDRRTPSRRLLEGGTPIAPILVRLPTINIPCGYCDGHLPPHNSGYPGISKDLAIYADGSYQIFQFPYLCQNCKKQPVIFFVLREGLKLQIVGRSAFPEAEVPKCIPINEKKSFKRAVICHKSGFYLGAFFYLRSFVEQYMRRVTKTAETTRLTGDELGDLYAKWLAAEYAGYPAGLPSLKKVYDDLSGHIHAGHDSEDTTQAFDDAKEEIDLHFQQIEVLRRAASRKAAAKPAIPNQS